MPAGRPSARSISFLLARDAQPGSDHQLAFVNALCGSVLSPRHVEALSALLDGDPAELGLAGLAVDTDLRWRIVTALATAGAIDADGPETPRIDAEAQRFSAADTGITGAPTAAGAAADVPGFIFRLGFHGQQLSQPMVAMLNAFALSALQLLAGPQPAALSGGGRRAT